MNTTNLLEEYSDIIQRCRDNDCGYSEAIQQIKAERYEKTLDRFFQ